MVTHRLAALGALMALSQGALAVRLYDTDSEFRFRTKVATGKSVEIQGVNGDVIAERSSGEEVEIFAQKRVKNGHRSKVRLAVYQHSGGMTVAAVYPEPSDTEIMFHIRVPAGVQFVGRTSNGRVAVSGIQGAVEAHTVNGDIDVHSESTVRASTVNGSITAEAKGAQLETVNGNVTLLVASKSKMDVDAATVHGDFIADIPFVRLGQHLRNHWKGAVGRGGPAYGLKTVNGDIRLERPR